ncbi:kappa-casein [Phyllostomus hastatus]|uniref:kappa-casein n=1 Tax=Phyllostomus hastatus TaxID=9423 RepID=UPI001E684274|nr:kappa-casein [Phyllostomus hastatus]
MKSFFLVVNMLALTLPFLCAEVQNQEQLTCHENDKRLVNQKTVKYIPIHYVLKSYPHSELNYYQYRPAISINSQYVPHPYYAKQVSVRPCAQIPQWQVLPIIYPLTRVSHPYLYPRFIVVPPKKIQDKTVIPTINTIAAVEPTSTPTIQPTIVVIQEASSEFITSTPEATTVTFTSPVV